MNTRTMKKAIAIILIAFYLYCYLSGLLFNEGWNWQAIVLATMVFNPIGAIGNGLLISWLLDK